MSVPSCAGVPGRRNRGAGQKGGSGSGNSTRLSRLCLWIPVLWQVVLGAAVAAIELAHGLDGKDAEQVGAAAQVLFEQAQRLGR